MAAGAAATIRAYKGRNRVAHPKARKISTTGYAAGAIRGGQGPVKRDTALPFYKGTAA